MLTIIEFKRQVDGFSLYGSFDLFFYIQKKICKFS